MWHFYEEWEWNIFNCVSIKMKILHSPGEVICHCTKHPCDKSAKCMLDPISIMCDVWMWWCYEAKLLYYVMASMINLLWENYPSSFITHISCNFSSQNFSYSKLGQQSLCVFEMFIELYLYVLDFSIVSLYQTFRKFGHPINSMAHCREIWIILFCVCLIFLTFWPNTQHYSNFAAIQVQSNFSLNTSYLGFSFILAMP